MTIPFPGAVPQGWVCPKCGAVLSPSCLTCFYCRPQPVPPPQPDTATPYPYTPITTGGGSIS